MRSGPPGETISDVQLITSKTEQMFKCFKVNDVGKKCCIEEQKNLINWSTFSVNWQKPVNKYISKLIIVRYADVRAYSSHVNIYCQEGTSVVLSSMTPSPQTFKN